MQDAVNLGWKLAQVIKGTSADSLLDTYQAERHPVGARVLENTMAQVALHREDARTLAARDIVRDLLRMEEPRKHIAGMMSGLDICYRRGADSSGRLRRLGRRWIFAGAEGGADEVVWKFCSGLAQAMGGADVRIRRR